MENTGIDVPKGLDKVIVDTTAISSTDAEGELIYRGYHAIELAEKLAYEETAYLVVYGKLPSKDELKEFSGFLSERASLDKKSDSILREISSGRPKIIDSMRSTVSFMHIEEKENDKVLLEIAAKMPRISSDAFRYSRGTDTLPEPDGSLAERFYYLITGKADKKDARYFEKLLVMYMEHEFNASTFALRVAASTLTDPRSAIVAALATIKGPLHGGANSEVLEYMLKAQNRDDARKFMEYKLSRKEKVMGFGHRVYKKVDPRAQFIKKELLELSKAKGRKELYDIAIEMEREMWERKKIPANLDFYAAIYMYLLGIDEAFYLPIFASSRCFGWTAHYIEQVSNNKLIRPSSRYTGASGLSIRKGKE